MDSECGPMGRSSQKQAQQGAALDMSDLSNLVALGYRWDTLKATRAAHTCAAVSSMPPDALRS